MPQSMQVSDGKACTLDIVKVQTEQIGGTELSTSHHHRHLQSQIRERLVGQLTRQHNHTIHFALLQHEQAAFFFYFIPVTADKQWCVPRLLQNIFDTTQCLTIKRTVDELCQHPNTHCTATRKASGGGIRLKIQFFYRCPHKALLFMTNLGSAIEYS